jgi:uncharacterized protein
MLLSMVMQHGDLEPRLERIVEDVVRRAVRIVSPERIWLFGSQARGTATRSSDVDIALQLPEAARKNWSRLVLETAEEVPALVNIDLVDIGQCSSALAHEIVNTGRVIYEARDAAGA